MNVLLDALRSFARSRRLFISGCEQSGSTLRLGTPWIVIVGCFLLGLTWVLREFSEFTSSSMSATSRHLPTHRLIIEEDGSLQGTGDEAERAGTQIAEKSRSTRGEPGRPNNEKLLQPTAHSQVDDPTRRDTLSRGNRPDASTPHKDQDLTPVMIGLLDRATDLAGQSSEVVDNLLAVAERQAEIPHEQGMNTSLELARFEAMWMEDESAKFRALKKLSQTQAKLGATDEAKATSMLIDDSLIRDAALVTVSNVEARGNEVASAKQTALGIRHPGKRAEALSGIAHAQARSTDVAGAKQTVFQIPDAEAQSRALHRIAIVQLQQSDLEGAQQTVGTIPIRDVKESARADLAIRAVRIGDVCCAEAIARSISNQEARDRALLAIAKWQSGAGDLEGSRRVTARITDRQVRSEALRQIAVQTADAGDVTTARNMARLIPQQSQEERALAGIASIQAEQDDRDARFTAQLIRDTEIGSLAERNIATTLARRGEVGNALSVAKGIPTATHQAAAYLQIGWQQYLRGDRQSGDAALDNARTAAGSIPGSRPQSQQLSRIALTEARVGDYRDAVMTANQIGDPPLRDRTFEDLAVEFAGNGEIETAWKTIEAIAEPRNQHKASLAVASRVGTESPVTAAPRIVRHFPTPDEKIHFILAVADQNSR